MVHLYGGRASFTACVFDNGRFHDLFVLSRGLPPGGLDIYLEYIPATLYAPEAPPPVVHVVGGRSTSWQFLRTTDREPQVAPSDQCMIQGFVHGCRHWTSMPQDLAAAIYWNGLGRTTTLVLIGCVLRPPPEARAMRWGGRIEVGPAAQRVIDIGTVYDGGGGQSPFVNHTGGVVLMNRLLSLAPSRTFEGMVGERIFDLSAAIRPPAFQVLRPPDFPEP